MSWRLAHKGECRNSEWVEVGGVSRCVIPLFEEETKELASIESIQRNWRGSWVEMAQADVIKVREGYFIINPNGHYHYPPIFEELLDPHSHCQ